MAKHEQPALGQLLRRWRRRKGLSQHKVGTAIGVTGQFIWAVERGNSNMSDESLGRLVMHYPDFGEELSASRLRDVMEELRVAEASGKTPIGREELDRLKRMTELARRQLDEIDGFVRALEERMPNPREGGT